MARISAVFSVDCILDAWSIVSRIRVAPASRRAGLPMTVSSESNSRPDRRRTILLAAVKLVVSLIAFWLVLRAVDYHELLKQFSAADPTWIGFGMLSLIAHFALVVWRWDYVLVKFYGLRLGLRRLSLVFGLGEALGP